MKSLFPGIASLAAQIEMFGLSKRELEKKFVRSELVLLAWRSQEMAAHFERQTPKQPPEITMPRRAGLRGMIPEGLPDKFFNKDGEVDLRQVTGEEAYKFMQAVGIKLPIMGRRGEE